MGNRAYFAYGANLDMNHMSCTCPASVFMGHAELHGYRFLINRDGWATVVRDENSSVHGVLWILSEECERVLDIQEDVEGSLYRKDTVAVKTESGNNEAMIYVARTSEKGVPNPGYLERIIAWACNLSFPEPYRRHLQSHHQA